MGKFERSIKHAINLSTGELVNADEQLSKENDPFDLRGKVGLNHENFECYECGQKLRLATSKYQRIHFRHAPNSAQCVLKDTGLSKKEARLYNATIASKESQRHKDLKNKLGEHLLETKGVDRDTVFIDNRFIVRGDEKRRPDVYGKYHDREIVFEIQLSRLSISYILSRSIFYKKHGIYLVWILDNFNVQEDQKAFELDIKYLSEHQNFFHLDESSSEFRLMCEFKTSVVVESLLELRDKWVKKSVNFNQLKFDSRNYQVYYKNFEQLKAHQQTKLDHFIQEAQRKEELENRTRLEWSVNEIKEELRTRLKDNRSGRYRFYEPVSEMMNNISKEDLPSFNELLGFNSTGEDGVPFIFKFFRPFHEGNLGLVEFILDSETIIIDVNARDKNGVSLFGLLALNNLLNRDSIVRRILTGGYVLSSEELGAISRSEIDPFRKVMIEVCNRISNRELVEGSYMYIDVILILESINRKRIVGYNWQGDEWLSFANYVVRNHHNQWRLFEHAFKKKGLWEPILVRDRKQTFISKVDDARSRFYRDNDHKFVSNLVKDLYPDFQDWEHL